jgi:hypothetical protein
MYLRAVSSCITSTARGVHGGELADFLNVEVILQPSERAGKVVLDSGLFSSNEIHGFGGEEKYDTDTSAVFPLICRWREAFSRRD